jgi:hypothetical protein
LNIGLKEERMFRAWLGVALSMALIGPAIAQEKSDQDTSAYKGLSAAELRAAYCVYNDKLFSKGSEICVRKGAALKCEGGTWATVTNVCTTAPDAHPAF